ncbi:hypothetical protein [Streptacidiphilus carbonis]|uniref:hypothetical protein n=1 Tax=Streptacidiphilus carbonis TaxID=105422 RepID=UPI0005A6E552|nr:hypothetical protein [Streptacidiphilus carbonis]
MTGAMPRVDLGPDAVRDMGPFRPGPTGPRLFRLHLISRQAPGALAALVGCAVLLRVALHLRWIQGGGASAQQLLLLIECGAAAAVAVATRNPFGESERSTGFRLPLLRLGAALLLTGAAVGALVLGAVGARLPGGAPQVLRDVPGLTAVGLLTAAALGGALAWVGPLTYTVVAEFALLEDWHTPWMWPARPPHDLGAWVCAGLAFAAATAVASVRGDRAA